MPKSLQEILAHADELSRRAEETEPDWSAAEVTPLGEVYEAVQRRAAAEAALADAVRRAHATGSSWRVIGMALGTSASAVRQRYGQQARGVGRPASRSSGGWVVRAPRSSSGRYSATGRIYATKDEAVAAEKKAVKAASGRKKGAAPSAGSRRRADTG